MAGVQEEEFDEGEVWDVLQEDRQAGTEVPAPRIATPPRNRRGKKAGVSTVPVEGARRGKTRPSAPVAIPAGSSSSRRRGDDEPPEDEDGEMLPPHEWLARKMERLGGASAPPASPPEVRGGRSKGKEMRKIRDAVLPKTAFSEH